MPELPPIEFHWQKKEVLVGLQGRHELGKTCAPSSLLLRVHMWQGFPMHHLLPDLAAVSRLAVLSAALNGCRAQGNGKPGCEENIQAKPW